MLLLWSGQSNYYRCTLKKWRKYSTVTQRNLPERNRIKVPTFFGFGYRYGKISPRFYDKHDEFSFFNVQMQNFHGNVSWSIFYGTVSSDILHIAKPSSSVLRFDGKTNELITRMEKHCGNRRKVIKQILRPYENHRLVF